MRLNAFLVLFFKLFADDSSFYAAVHLADKAGWGNQALKLLKLGYKAASYI